MRKTQTAMERIAIADLTGRRLTRITQIYYGFEPLGLLWKNRGVVAAAPPAARIAIVAGTPRPNNPPPPAAAAPAGALVPAPAPTATPGPTTGAAAPCGKHISSTPPAAGSVLPAEPCWVVISPLVPLAALRMTHPKVTIALTFACSSNVSATFVLGAMSSDPSGPRL